MRLSIINFAGIARTLVAVGTVSDASIDATTRPATPRSGSIVAALGVAKTGAGLTGACAGAGVETIGAATGAGVETTISANGAAGGSVTSIAPNRAAGVTATPYANAGNVTQQNTFQFQMPAGSTQSQVDALRGAVGQSGVLDGVTRQMAVMGAQ